MLVSVIIPTYNRAVTVRQSVQSALDQTWKSLEIIVVDDGSRDQTAEALAIFGDKIRVIRQENAGASAARNTGIRAAKGDVISFLDSDDLWLPEKTEQQVKLLERTRIAGVNCCVCNAKMVSESGAVSTSFGEADLNPRCRQGIWTNAAEILTTRFLLFNQVVDVRRELLDQAGYFRQDLKIMEDYDLALRLSLLGPWGFNADPLVIRQGGSDDSLSSSASRLDIFRLALAILNDLKASSRWGTLMPRALLCQRMRNLSHKINAIELSTQPNPFARVFGRLLLQCLRAYDVLYWRLPSTPRLIAKCVE
jgi:glycosyltransferase involved in cell wall biosynthesis